VPGDLDDRRVEVDRQRLRARAGASCPRSPNDRLEGAVELAHVAEGERAQERPQRRGGDHPLPEHALRLAAAQHVGVVDRVTADKRRVDERQELAARPSRTRPLTQVERLVHDLLYPEPPG